MKRVSNSSCRPFVQQRTPFQGSNLYAINLGQGTDDFRYVVYSYGIHWPLFVYTNGCWFENEQKHSVSTSKHRSQSHPHHPTILLSTHWMRTLADCGYSAIAKERILGTDMHPIKQSRTEAMMAYFGG